MSCKRMHMLSPTCGGPATGREMRPRTGREMLPMHPSVASAQWLCIELRLPPRARFVSVWPAHPSKPSANWRRLARVWLPRSASGSPSPTPPHPSHPHRQPHPNPTPTGFSIPSLPVHHLPDATKLLLLAILKSEKPLPPATYASMHFKAATRLLLRQRHRDGFDLGGCFCCCAAGYCRAAAAASCSGQRHATNANYTCKACNNILHARPSPRCSRSSERLHSLCPALLNQRQTWYIDM